MLLADDDKYCTHLFKRASFMKFLQASSSRVGLIRASFYAPDACLMARLTALKCWRNIKHFAIAKSANAIAYLFR